MATTREQFIALRKSGMTPVQAREEVMKTVTPVSQTTNANVAQLEANRARVQSQIASGERPAVGTSVTPQAEQTQAPTPPPAPVTSSTTPSGATMNADWTVTPTTPVTPVTTTTPPVTTTPAPVTPKVEPVKTPVVDYTQAQWREQEIMSNLEKFKTQWMTPDQIKWASGYENATPEKKAIIEWFLNPVKQDAGTIFSTLRAGGSVPMSDTPEYRQAQARYNTFKRFTTYDVASLSTAMQQGDLLMGTQAYNDVISDPNMLAKIQKARIFMNGEVDMVKIGEKQGQYVMTQNPTVAKALEDGYITAEEYNQMTSTPEVEAQAKVVSEAKTKYDEYKRQLEQIDDDVDKEYEGKETTDSFRSAIKANRDKAVRRLYNSASDDLQNASGLYTELKNSSTQRLELNMKQYEQQQADARQLASEERAVQRSKDALQYEADFNKKQAEAALNDPATAIKSVMDEYKKLGIPFTSTVQSRLAEFNASWKTLPQFLTDMGKNIQASPAYQKYQALQQGQMSDVQKVASSQAFQNQSDIRNFAQQKELAKYNNDLNRQEFLFKIENDPEQKAKALALQKSLESNKSLFDVLGKNVGTYEGNRGYDLAWNLWDPLPAGGNWTVKSIDTAGEQVGSIFIGGKGKKPYGNTVVMEDENKNEIRYSHLQDIGVKPGDVLGFWDIVGTRGNTGNVKGANGETLTAEQLKAGRWAHLDVEIKSNGKLLSNADQVKFLKELKSTPSLWKDELKAISTARTNLEQDPQYKAYRTLANQVADVKGIQSRINNWTASPQDQQQMITAFSKVLDPTSVVRESEFELTKKYGQAGYQAVLQNVSQYWRWDWILNPESAKILAESLASRYGSIEQEYNNQLQLAKDNIEMNIWRPLSNKEFETLTQTKFSNQTKKQENSESNDPFGIR